MAKVQVKKASDGRILARRVDGRPLNETDRKEAKRLAAAEADDPVLTVDQWYPEFHRFHRRVIAEAGDFDYGQIRKERPDLYQRIKAKEAEIDALDSARLSQILAIMTEWRQLILEGRANYGSADFTLPGVQARRQRRV